MLKSGLRVEASSSAESPVKPYLMNLVMMNRFVGLVAITSFQSCTGAKAGFWTFPSAG
jgi:hypothetical protein